MPRARRGESMPAIRPRLRASTMAVSETSATLASRETILCAFEAFRDELDDHNDRRERLIKNSRDVTNLSKKVIFLLHRIVTEEPSDAGAEIGPNPDRKRALRAAGQARGKLKEVQKLLASIASEVQGDRYWRYQRNVSPGLQEYIEALSFAHYLETGKLVTFNEVQLSISDEHGVPYFPLSVEDYLLGLSDLTGELMRYAISSISRRGGRSIAREVCTFMRACKADFEGLTPYFPELRKKQHVTSQSLEKIEDAAYAIAVRSSEYDLPLDLLDDIVSRAVSTTYSRGEAGSRKRARDDDDEDNYDD